MPHDMNGVELKVGDKVYLPCEITWHAKHGSLVSVVRCFGDDGTPIYAVADELIAGERPTPQPIAEALSEMRMRCLDVRDAVNRYHSTHLQNDLDELERLTGMLNREEIVTGLPKLRTKETPAKAG